MVKDGSLKFLGFRKGWGCGRESICRGQLSEVHLVKCDVREKRESWRVVGCKMEIYVINFLIFTQLHARSILL